MTAIMKSCGLAVLAAAALSAATTNTTMTVSASGPFNGTGVTLTGTATFTNNVGSGNFSASVSLSSISGTNFVAPFTITFTSGATGTLTGNITVPASIISGTSSSGSASGSATITGGTGTYAGATGSFTLSGTGSLNASTLAVSVNFTGPGTITTGGSGGGTTPPPATTPTITAVQDAASYTSQIAEGSIFVVKGSNLSPSGLGTSGLLSFGFPLPSTSNGVSISFTSTSGGSPTNAYLIYLYNSGGTNQLAAILPSSLTPGNYNVTVTSGGATSSAFAVSVVKSKPEMFTLNQAGNGLAIVQNYVSASETDENLYVKGVLNSTNVSPAYPGQTLIAWLTGLGPITSGDNTAAPVLNVATSSNVQVIVGGITITPTFAGRAPGLAGEDQVDFMLPANVPTGCGVSFQIVANGVASAPTYIAIASDANASACVQPGFTAAQLQDLQNGLFTGSSSSTLTTGFFYLENFSETLTLPSIGPTTATIAVAGGEFLRYTGFQLANYTASNPFAATNSCQVIPLNVTSTSSSSGSGTTSPIVTGSATALDAGALTLTGPSGSNITNLAFTDTNNLYSLSISEQIPGLGSIPGMQNNGTVIGGQYTLKGAGGKDVGPFTAQVNLASPLTITGGLPSTVNRSSGLTLSWTGGNSSDLVLVSGLGETTNVSTTASGTTYTSTGAEFICSTTAGAGGITIPASITQQLAAVSSSAIGNGGGVSSLVVYSTTNPTNNNGIFTAPLTAGGNITSYFLTLVGTANTPTWQ